MIAILKHSREGSSLTLEVKIALRICDDSMINHWS